MSLIDHRGIFPPKLYHGSVDIIEEQLSRRNSQPVLSWKPILHHVSVNFNTMVSYTSSGLDSLTVFTGMPTKCATVRH